MSSAEREARDKAFRDSGGIPERDRAVFEAGWSARAEYTRGATVAEIVEALRTGPEPHPRSGFTMEAFPRAAEFIEARFSPAAPPEREEG